MTSSPRIVIDNNVLISRLLLPGSVPGRAVRKAIDTAQVLVSEDTLAELAIVLARSKFDPYLTIGDRQEFMRLFGRVAERVPITYKAHACRDRKDNNVLEVAVNGRADLIITGDHDLLALRVFQEIPIITPSEYLRT
jgi:putative PIN family toxin of toxin-antitoxin system